MRRILVFSLWLDMLTFVNMLKISLTRAGKIRKNGIKWTYHYHQYTCKTQQPHQYFHCYAKMSRRIRQYK